MTTDRLEFRFLWNAAEHRRFYRAVLYAVARRGKRRWLYLVLIVAVAALVVGPYVSANHASPARIAMEQAPYLIIILIWVALMGWGMPYLGARTYARQHQACIPHDQVRVVSDDGIEARCVSSDVKVQWQGISRVLETPEFILFFTTPNCAFQLPKRAIPSAEQLDALRQLAGRHSHIEQSSDVA